MVAPEMGVRELGGLAVVRTNDIVVLSVIIFLWLTLLGCANVRATRDPVAVEIGHEAIDEATDDRPIAIPGVRR
jgi:hypothetical protein